jgi:putative transposase
MRRMKTTSFPQRKRVRLSSDIYAQLGTICSVTVTVQNRQQVFADRDVADASVRVLLAHAQKTEVQLYCYCVMPDHVHLLLTPSSCCDIITFTGQFKNLTLRAAWKFGITGTFWQQGFYDHFVRKEERLMVVVDYIRQNPVRAGLVSKADDYLFSGYNLSADGGGQAPALQI